MESLVTNIESWTKSVNRVLFNLVEERIITISGEDEEALRRWEELIEPCD